MDERDFELYKNIVGDQRSEDEVINDVMSLTEEVDFDLVKNGKRFRDIVDVETVTIAAILSVPPGLLQIVLPRLLSELVGVVYWLGYNHKSSDEALEALNSWKVGGENEL